MKALTLVSALAITQLTIPCAFAGGMVYKNGISFLDPAPGSSGNYAFLPDPSGHKTVATGTPASPGDTPSIITLHGDYENMPLRQPFALAHVTYTNGVNWAGTALDSVPVQAGFWLVDSPGFCGCPLYEWANVTFDLGINSTPNFTDNPYLDADSLSIHGETSKYFTAFGAKFQLELLGFGTSECNYAHEFIVPEGETHVMALYARLTPHCVPEPSTFALCGMGGLALVRLARHRRRLTSR